MRQSITSHSAIQPAFWGRHVLETCYEQELTVIPADATSYTLRDHWWHLILPFEKAHALLAGEVRREVEAAIVRFVGRLQAQRPRTRLAASRTGPTHIECLLCGHAGDRRFVRARLRLAVSRSYRMATGEKLGWRLAWAALLNTPRALRQAEQRFCLSERLDAARLAPQRSTDPAELGSIDARS